MLKNVSAEIRECYEHAKNWAHKAAAQTDSKLKADFLDLERRWLFLVRSYEFTKRLTDFSGEAMRRAEARPAKKLTASTSPIPDRRLLSGDRRRLA